jgi:hypothetical protein
MNSSVFKFTDLKQKKQPKKEKEFDIGFEYEAKPVPKKRELDEGEREPEKEGEPEKEMIDEEPKFTDKVGETLVDRKLILKRLRRPVENKLLSKSPEDADELYNKKSRKEAEEDEDDKEREHRIQKKAEKAESDDDKEDLPEEPTQTIDEELEAAEKEGIDFGPKTKKGKSKKAVTVEAVEEVTEDEGQAAEGVPAKKSRGKKAEAAKANERFDLTTEKIGDQLIIKRVPSKQKFAVRVSNYYMNNRKIYISELAQLFRIYSDKIAKKAAELSCKTLHTQSVDFELLTHQLVVRDYLNLYTPYRGLLLYHGLGSGKTCTSIGIAEGMKTGKQIVLMTPASLKMNFFNELKKCGDALYKKNQFWEFVSIEDDVRRGPLLAQILGLDPEYVRRKKGAWLMNVTKKPNFEALSDNDQKNVDQQIDEMIRNKYMDINYNGIRKEKLEEMSNGGTRNIFDNKVVIIDEAHNLVSNIANSGHKRGTKAYRFYHDLMDATNAKVIFLTGTPIINKPREIAILFNMLRGYIKTWTFSLQTTTSDKVNTEILMDAFRAAGLTMYDYVEYTTNKLVITRNPFGFVNAYHKGSKPGKRGGKTKRVRINKKANAKAVTKKVREIYDDDEGPVDDEQRELQKNYNELNNPYEGGSSIPIESIELTGGGAYEDYAGVRLDEMGNISDHVFETRLTKVLNNLGIRVIGKPKLVKNTCLPDDEDVFNENFINGEKGELINIDLLKRRILGLTSYFRSAQESLLPAFVKTPAGSNYNIVNVDMSDYQFEEYEKIRKDERTEEKRRKKKTKVMDDLDEKSASTYRIYSRSACNFIFPAEHPRPRGHSKFDLAENADEYFEEEDPELTKGLAKEISTILNKPEIDEEDPLVKLVAKGLAKGVGKGLTNKDDLNAEVKQSIAGVPKVEVAVETQIQDAYDFLRYDPDRRRSKEYLTEDQLGLYSPKYLEILRNIKAEENRGLHLLYSQFRSLEGIGIFKLILEANGFVEFKLTKRDNQWEIVDWDKDPEKPRFALYTGTETAEEKDIVRNIYNGSWHIVPPSIVEKLRERNADNLYGEVIKVLMITASGAEGINLRNTRFVHIMEPYWNMVRVDQVVGRARRICSHEDLPEELRTVEVFIYLCRATPEQVDKNLELKINDLSKLTYNVYDEKRAREIMERIPFTTDQYLLEIAHIKDSITKQILKVVKETAMDCSLYNSNPEEPLVCYGFGEVEPQSFASYPTLERDSQEKPAQAKEKRSYMAVKVDEVSYAVDKKSLVVYDMESYKRAKEKRGELVEVGRYDERTKKVIFI